jgi:hypothetical protein
MLGAHEVYAEISLERAERIDCNAATQRARTHKKKEVT